VRVEEDVEFGGWSDVASSDGSSHHYDLGYFGFYLGVSKQQGA